LVQFSEVRGGASYLSQNDLRLHFGLGVDEKMTEVNIRWPNGATETLRDLGADYLCTIVEGSGIQQKSRCVLCCGLNIRSISAALS
jgi:hypothetical protein